MANTVSIPQTTALAATLYVTKPVVYINDKISPYMDVLSVTQQVGVAPASATLRVNKEQIRNSWSTSQMYPSTLNMLLGSGGDSRIRQGSKVIIVYEGNIIFIGSLMSRSDQGLSDETIYEAIDDRSLLNYMFCRGQVVSDNGILKYITGRPHNLNPNGSWNMIGAEVNFDGKTIMVPVFSDRAMEGVAFNYSQYSSNDVRPLSKDYVSPWTPKYYLMHLAFLANVTARDGLIQGLDEATWRSLTNSERLRIDFPTWSTVSASSYSYADESGKDPLQTILPAVNLQGQSYAGALDTILKICGTHQLKLEFSQAGINLSPEGQTNDPTEAVSYLILSPAYFNAQSTNGSTMTDIPLLVGGNATDVPDSNTVYDFKQIDDYNNVASAVLIDGDSVKVEGLLQYGNGIRQMWSLEDETYFKAIINGSETYPYFAKYPSGQSTPLTGITFVLCDGLQGRPLAYRWTREAVTLARNCYPDVYRRFSIVGSDPLTKTLLSGFDSRYADLDQYPVLTNKIALAKQLQYFISDPTGLANESTYTTIQYPVRLIFNQYGQDGGMINITVNGDGSFYMDQAESHDSLFSCIYSGCLFNSNPMALPFADAIAIKPFSLNIALYADHRVTSYKDVNVDSRDGNINNQPQLQKIGVFADSFANDLGGQPLRYIDAKGYSELHQVNSNPAAGLLWRDGDTTVTSPFSRLLPSGDNAVDLEQYALRRLSSIKISNRTSEYKVIGIRPIEYPVGIFINNLQPIVGSLDGNSYPLQDGQDWQKRYPIQDIIHAITMDFRAYVTTISFRQSMSNNL